MKTRKTWELYWAPEGKLIGTVQASTEHAAVRKAPMPYKQYFGEIYAKLIGEEKCK